MGLLDALMDLKGGLMARKERAYEAGLRAGEVEDAKALLGRYGAETAGQLGPGLLSSASPAQRQASLMLLADLAGRQTKAQQLDQAQLEAQKPLPPLQAAQLQGQSLANIAAARGITQQGIMDPLQAEQARVTLDNSRLQTDASRFALSQALAKAAEPQPVLPYGEPPKGYFPSMSPAGELQYIPQPGTEPFNKATDIVREQEDMVRDLQLLQTLIGEVGASGTEWAGPQARQLALLRGNVAARLFKLRNYGAPQAAELELAFQQLPDPTGLIRNVLGALSVLDPTGASADFSRETIQAPYTQFRKLVEESLRGAYRTYWYTDKRVGYLPETAR